MAYFFVLAFNLLFVGIGMGESIFFYVMSDQ